MGGEANFGKSQNGSILGKQYNTNTVSPTGTIGHCPPWGRCPKKRVKKGAFDPQNLILVFFFFAQMPVFSSGIPSFLFLHRFFI